MRCTYREGTEDFASKDVEVEAFIIAAVAAVTGAWPRVKYAARHVGETDSSEREDGTHHFAVVWSAADAPTPRVVNNWRVLAKELLPDVLMEPDAKLELDDPEDVTAPASEREGLAPTPQV
jgi:hypothetical protein